MAKLKAPFMSFGATGTVGQALTVSGHKGLHVAKTIPTHPDARTAAQLAHRELYSHARDLWLTLTPGERAQLLTDARPYHMTGYNLLLHRYLKDLLSLEAWWPLNDGGGPIARDYSLHQTDGTVFGCIAAPDFCGQAGNAFWFDGVNDRIVATTPQLDFTSTDFSFIFRLRVETFVITRLMYTRGLHSVDGLHISLHSLGAMSLYTFQAAAFQETATAVGSIAATTWYTIGMSRQGTTANIYRDGIDITAVHGNHLDPLTSARTAKIGIADNEVAAPAHGRICDFKAFSRALTPAQHLAAHQRYCVHPPR